MNCSAPSARIHGCHSPQSYALIHNQDHPPNDSFHWIWSTSPHHMYIDVQIVYIILMWTKPTWDEIQFRYMCIQDTMSFWFYKSLSVISFHIVARLNQCHSHVSNRRIFFLYSLIFIWLSIFFKSAISCGKLPWMFFYLINFQSQFCQIQSFSGDFWPFSLGFIYICCRIEAIISNQE
jgi:hypothetical protein